MDFYRFMLGSERPSWQDSWAKFENFG